MIRPFAKPFFLIAVSTAIAVLGSLGAVWLLRQTMGFRFMPTLVASVSGSITAIVVATQSWRSRARTRDAA